MRACKAAAMKNHPTLIVLLLIAHGVVCASLLPVLFSGLLPMLTMVRHLQ